MNKKGQMGLGIVLSIAIVAIVAVVLFQASAQQVGNVVNTVAVANDSLGTATTNTTTLYMTNYKSISSVVIYNITGDAIVPSTNYTVTNNFVYNGQEAVKVALNLSDIQNFTGYGLNISGTAQPLTYDASSGGRSMASLVILMTALAIGVVVIGAVNWKDIYG